MIYEPREDSFLLQKYVGKYAKGKVLDMGTGSGIQAETALKNTKDVLASDIDEASLLFVKNRGIKTIKSDLFSNIKGKFDLIIFNPPYLPFDIDEDPASSLATAGGPVGFEIIKRFLKQAKHHLNQDGKILLIVSSLTEDVESIFKKYNFGFRLLEEKKIFFEILKVYLVSSLT